jgi:16S rRNA G966 N2-methylase RsmD
VMQYCNNTANSYDLILADPPFIYPPLPQLVTTITSQGILQENGIFVIEHELTNPIDKTSPNYNIIQQKKYGRSLVSFLVRNVHES